MRFLSSLFRPSRSLCIRIALLGSLAPLLWAANRPLHPNKRPKTVDLRGGDVTTIMGYRAQLEGKLTHAPMELPFMYKEALVYGFAEPGDAMTWTVRALQDGAYAVSLIYTGDRDALARCKGEIVSDHSRLTFEPKPRDWDGKPFYMRLYVSGTLRLTKGKNRISLRLTNVSPGQVKRARLAIAAQTQPLRRRTFSVWSIELGLPEARRAQLERSRRIRGDTSWMVKGKYGLFVHWSPLGYAFRGEKRRFEWHEQAVNEFDVEAFADAVAETGAAWVCFTSTHGKQYWPGPNKTIDGILPGRTTGRDLIGELARALATLDIRLLLYYHFGGNREDPEWARAVGLFDEDPRRWHSNVEKLFEETSLRYGKRVGGFAYIDGGGFIAYQSDPPWERWARAIKAGNPEGLVGYSQNFGPTVSPFNELEITDGGGELRPPSPQQMFHPEGPLGAVQPARWFVVDRWVSSGPYQGRFGDPPRHAANEYIDYFRRMSGAGVPLTVNLKITANVRRSQPFFDPRSLEIMRQVRRAMRGALPAANRLP